MHILIYGAGAVGLGLASFLHQAGNNVCLLARKQTVESLRSSGLTRTGIFGTYSASPDTFSTAVTMQEVSDVRFDYILVCTKSFDTSTAAADIAAHPELIKYLKAVVLCQNGWGNTEAASPYLPAELLFNARVITGFNRPEHHAVDVTVHADAVHIGTLFDQSLDPVRALADQLSQGGMPCEVTDSIAKDLWAKMLYNCALNPLGALLRVPYGALGESSYARDIMDRIIEETFEAMTLAGFSTHWETPQEYKKLFYAHLIPKTADHESSMLQDIKARKPTEIEAINGAVLLIGKQYDKPFPATQMIVDMIRCTEQLSGV